MEFIKAHFNVRGCMSQLTVTSTIIVQLWRIMLSTSGCRVYSYVDCLHLIAYQVCVQWGQLNIICLCVCGNCCCSGPGGARGGVVPACQNCHKFWQINISQLCLKIKIISRSAASSVSVRMLPHFWLILTTPQQTKYYFFRFCSDFNYPINHGL